MAYGVGKSVYLVYERDGKYYVSDDVYTIKRVSVDEIGDHYALETPHEEVIDWCRDVFETLVQAEKVCGERNGK